MTFSASDRPQSGPRLEPGGWFVVVVSVAALAATGAALLGWPAGARADLRTNVPLAVTLLSLAVWWALALRATRGRAGRAAVAAGFAGALVGAAGALGLGLGGLGIVPPSVARWALPLLVLEVPLWALAVLLWPGVPRGSRPRAARALGALVLVAAASLLFWDFQIRPVGGFPSRTLARLAVLGWGVVLLALTVGVAKGSRPELRRPFRLLLLSLVVTVAGNYAITRVHAGPVNIVFAAAMVAALLRLGAAERLRTKRAG